MSYSPRTKDSGESLDKLVDALRAEFDGVIVAGLVCPGLDTYAIAAINPGDVLPGELDAAILAAKQALLEIADSSPDRDYCGSSLLPDVAEQMADELSDMGACVFAAVVLPHERTVHRILWARAQDEGELSSLCRHNAQVVLELDYALTREWSALKEEDRVCAFEPDRFDPVG